MVLMNQVTQNYPTQNQVLDQINLSLKRGDFLYVIGGTGAGKSSLLKLLATEAAPSSGSISLLGYPLRSVDPATLRLIRRSIGYIPQELNLLNDLTVFENVALSASVASGKGYLLSHDQKAQIRELLGVLGLGHKAEYSTGSLSGGEAQRLAVARALIRRPELILADEPTGAQDRDFKWALMDLFLKANQAGATVVLATHDREVVRRVRKKCAHLRGGKILLEEQGCFY
jgi:cell division transport system ATP-binding protein